MANTIKLHLTCLDFFFCFGIQIAVRSMSSSQSLHLQPFSWTRRTIGYSGLALEKLPHLFNAFILLLDDVPQVLLPLGPLCLLHADFLGRNSFVNDAFIC